MGIVMAVLGGCAQGGVGSEGVPLCLGQHACVGDDDDGAIDDGVDDDDGDDGDTGDDDDEGDDGDDTGDPAAPGLPCEVRDVLAAECGGCHGDPPSFGAPMELVDFADLHVPSKSDPTRSVFELVAERLVAVANPMPPGGEIDDGAKQVLLDWIAAGAPEDPAADCDDPIDPTGEDPVGPDALPCDDPVYLTAHAPGGAGPFAVPAVGAEDLYMCFDFASPFATGAQATAWAPAIDDERVVHHWILYRKEGAPQGDAYPCDVSLQVSADFVAGWAPGGENVVLPDHVGLELGVPNEHFVLQVHYHNAKMYDDSMDASGVAFCVADAPRPQTAGVLSLGTTSLSIPAGAVGHEEVGTCGWLLTSFWPGPLHLLGASPHMHELGRGMKTIVQHDGGATETLVDVQFDFNSQLMYMLDSEIVVNPGDVLTTTCRYDNPTGANVGFGEGTGDEMCFDFVLAYPIDQLDNRNCGILF